MVFRYILLGAVVAIVGSCAGCSKSTAPDGRSRYSLIVGDTYSQVAHVINPETNGIVDTIPIPSSVYVMIADPGQTELILEGGILNAIYKYDLCTGEQTGFRETYGWVSLLEVGKRLLLSGVDSLRVLDLSTLSTIESDTALVWDGVAYPGGSLVTGFHPSPPPPTLTGVIAFYDLQTGWHDTLSLGGGFVAIGAIPFPEGRRALVHGRASSKHSLFLVDASTRSVIQVADLVRDATWWSAVFSPSGDTAYVAASQDLDDPSVILCAVGDILAVAVPAGGSPSLISRTHFDSPVYDLALSPDGTRLYCGVVLDRCSGENHGGFIAEYDPQTMERVAMIEGYIHPKLVEVGPVIAR